MKRTDKVLVFSKAMLLFCVFFAGMFIASCSYNKTVRAANGVDIIIDSEMYNNCYEKNYVAYCAYISSDFEKVKDYSTSIDLLIRACDGNFRNTNSYCAKLAENLKQYSGVDLVKARNYFERTVVNRPNINDEFYMNVTPEIQFRLAESFEKQPPVDLKKAVQHYKKSCEDGYAVSCYPLEQLGGKYNRSVARENYEQRKIDHKNGLRKFDRDSDEHLRQMRQNYQDDKDLANQISNMGRH